MNLLIQQIKSVISDLQQFCSKANFVFHFLCFSDAMLRHAAIKMDKQPSNVLIIYSKNSCLQTNVYLGTRIDAHL